MVLVSAAYTDGMALGCAVAGSLWLETRETLSGYYRI